MKLRLPHELKEMLADAAIANNRSLNAEVVSRLQESFSGSASIDQYTLDLFAEKVVKALDEREKRRKKV